MKVKRYVWAVYATGALAFAFLGMWFTNPAMFCGERFGCLYGYPSVSLRQLLESNA
jgi:hypothetical protein